MAIVKPFHACALLIVLIFANEMIISCQGRHLMACKNKELCEGGSASKGIGKKGMQMVANSIDGSQPQHQRRVITEDISDDRPTNPGHSPGAGHFL
ncbi:hypothetical protein IHE45_18G011500 [Dioscorea alata]|uniref:Uncharacterized protein n=1 Tax=Dioscorea alata TaxID=55571 RepID=A0ACB7U595_DIOAL|nr:hypothetical protein IHE45_18G011500 [Dioscorea alata]